MALNFLGRLFDSNEAEVGKLRPLVEEITELEPELEKLDDEALRGKTAEFREGVADEPLYDVQQ